jgi:hypothetical protein
VQRCPPPPGTQGGGCADRAPMWIRTFPDCPQVECVKGKAGCELYIAQAGAARGLLRLDGLAADLIGHPCGGVAISSLFVRATQSSVMVRTEWLRGGGAALARSTSAAAGALLYSKGGGACARGPLMLPRLEAAAHTCWVVACASRVMQRLATSNG